MKLTVFGASGRTGHFLLDRALTEGHEVTAFVRDPAKLASQSPHLRIVKGDLQNAADVDAAVIGADAVISVLGPAGNAPDFAISKGTANIIEAMKRHGVRRLVISAGAGVSDPQDKPGLFDKAIKVALKTASKNVYEDMVRTVALVRDSELDWTVVRVPMLTDDPAKGRVRTGYIGQGTGPRISREDMADYMLEACVKDQHVHEAPVISN